MGMEWKLKWYFNTYTCGSPHQVGQNREYRSYEGPYCCRRRSQVYGVNCMHIYAHVEYVSIVKIFLCMVQGRGFSIGDVDKTNWRFSNVHLIKRFRLYRCYEFQK